MPPSTVKAKMLEVFRYRMFFYFALVSIVFVILILQLINLQIVQGKEYSLKSKLNMESNIPILAPRGEIFDRNFKVGQKNNVIVTNRPAFNLTTVPAKFKTKKQFRATIENLAKILNIDVKKIADNIKIRNPWERIVLVEDCDFTAIVKVASNNYLLPNIEWEDAPVRVYSQGAMFSHVVGYIGTINKKEYKKLCKKGYKSYQKIGKTGIEKEYDSYLRGKDGYLRRIVDVRNRTEGEEIGEKPVAGNNLVLTLDSQLQKKVFEVTKNMRGAVVVLKPSSGGILAMVSRPDFNPNLIISKNNFSVLKDLYANKDRPFLNRVIQSIYPPASTFKLVTTIAALENEVITPGQTYNCPGKFILHGYRDKTFYCYETHGRLNLDWAIAKSCSVYFYQLGYKVGPTKILRYAGYFGLNKKSGIDLPGERQGFLPSKKWKMKRFGQPWFDGDTINLAIGQGFTSVTMLEMADLVAGIVNKGIIYRPHVLKRIIGQENKKVVKIFKREKIAEIPLSPITLQHVTLGMRLSVMHGTSIALNGLKVPACGKTGTAQTVSRRNVKGSHHAWFVGFAPYGGNPENSLVIVVFVERGGYGQYSAAPIAKLVFEEAYKLGYFKQ